MDFTTALIGLAIASYSFLLGTLFGQYHERCWQREKQQTEEDLGYYQSEVDKVIHASYQEGVTANDVH